MREYKSPDDNQRPGQRIVNYAYGVARVHFTGKVPAIESWLYNLSEAEFKKVMKWSPEHD